MGWAALLLSLGLIVLYMPGSPAALVWPFEWLMLGGWVLLGVVSYVWARAVYGDNSYRIIQQELETGHSDAKAPTDSAE